MDACRQLAGYPLVAETVADVFASLSRLAVQKHRCWYDRSDSSGRRLSRSRVNEESPAADQRRSARAWAFKESLEQVPMRRDSAATERGMTR